MARGGTPCGGQKPLRHFSRGLLFRHLRWGDFLLRFLLFSIGPLVLELLMIAILLYVMLDIRYLAVIFLTIGVYVWFTFKVTDWRGKLRKKMTEQDTDAAQKAVDSLLNFETVKYFKIYFNVYFDKTF